MAATESTMLALGTRAPMFELPDAISGKTVSLRDFDNKKALLVMFLSPHCPYVQHLQRGLAAMTGEYAAKDVAMVAISSNDAQQYPDDAPEGLRRMASELGFTFPFLYDEGAGGGESLSRRLHAGLFRLRRRPAPRLSRAVRRQPAAKRHSGDRHDLAGGHRRGARRKQCGRAPDPEHRVQHQVEAR